MDFQALLAEFYARGFDYLEDRAEDVVRAKRWINDAMHEIDGLEQWPYLEATTSGPAPLLVADLAAVRSVTATVGPQVLTERSLSELLEFGADLTTTGSSATYFYVTGGDTLNVFPVADTDLSVWYWKVAPDLVDGDDEPLMPDRYRQAIVERAVAAALRDDQSPDSTIALLESERIVDQMREWASRLSPLRTVIQPLGDDC